MIRDILLLDSNAVYRLANPTARRRLTANLRATGRVMWPTAMNVLEALKSRDSDTRVRILTTLCELAGENHALPMPTDALRCIAEAFATVKPDIEWGDPRLTSVFRDPDGVTDRLASDVRAHLIEEEDRFTATHNEARGELLMKLNELGGRRKWPTVALFLDEVWNTPGHLHTYLTRLWETWGFSGDAPVSQLLSHRSWRLYFEAWGAAMYARNMAHPQPPLVQHADLVQLVYFGSARSAVLVSDDRGFRDLANSLLRGRHLMTEVVPVDAVIT